MITTDECENCKFSVITDEDKAKVMVYCKARGKTYYYGQCVPCDEKEKK